MRINLLDHVMALLAERDRRYQERFEAQNEALIKVESSMQNRFESVNEFRATLSDQAAHFVSQDQHDTVKQMVGQLSSRLDKLEGRSSGINAGWAYLIGMAAIVGAAITTYVALKN